MGQRMQTITSMVVGDCGKDSDMEHVGGALSGKTHQPPMGSSEPGSVQYCEYCHYYFNRISDRSLDAH